MMHYYFMIQIRDVQEYFTEMLHEHSHGFSFLLAYVNQSQRGKVIWFVVANCIPKHVDSASKQSIELG